ncbi:MAG: nucleoside kinase [Clostridia bacterium]|nr:nucleoside kinase [Clostridia bacterium]
MVKILVDGKEFEVEDNIKVSDFLNLHKFETESPIMGVLINNVQRSLTHEIKRDSELRFITYKDLEGEKIYRRSLLFLFVKVCEELYPESNVVVSHSINQGVYCELRNCSHMINEELRALIDDRMRELVAAKLPFIKRKVPKEEAIKMYKTFDQPDKIGILDAYENDIVTIYSCGNFNNYFFGYMLPDTSYLTMFEIRLYEGGFLIRYPKRGNFNELPPYVDQKKLFNIFREFKTWNRILNVENVSMLNKVIEDGHVDVCIRVAEALQEKKYAGIADQIKENPDKKIILLAGPSSSGKTTSSHRIAIQLLVNGIKPAIIGLDDYFVNRDRTPIGEDGKHDFESLYAIDLELFNEHLQKLLAGEEIEVPKFNFVEGKREPTGRKLKLLPDQVIIFEGIHALNEKLTESIPRDKKFKIYVSSLTSINIDDHNVVRTTDARLLRRMVRDYQFRGHTPERTLELWNAVVRGEEKNIFPFQEDADAMFNSAMIYEIGVLKGFAKPLLEKIEETSPYYIYARRMLDLLQYFEVINPENVPQNSIIREFIGGSCFDL